MRLYLLMLATLWASMTVAQTSLSEALNHYEQTDSIKFSFDADVFGVVKQSSFDTIDINHFFNQIETLLPFAVEPVSEKYFVIKVVESEFVVTALDSMDMREIPAELGVTALINGEVSPTRFSDGKWTFNYKPIAGDSVQLYVPGFKRQDIPFADFVNQKQLIVSFGPEITELPEMVIEEYITKGINLDPSSQSVKIDVGDLPLLPGETDGDIFASITALPGVTNPDGRAGNLFIRGSDPDQTLILFDNIPVYHKGHYFGTISPYNPKVIDNVEVYRGGYHPRFGDRVGGAIVIESEESGYSRPGAGVGVNTLFGMAYGKVPLIDKKLGLTVGARHSYPSSINSPKHDAITKAVFSGTPLIDSTGRASESIAVVFEDYFSKVTFKPNEQNTLSISGIYTYSDVYYTTEPGGQVNNGNKVDNQFSNLGFNAKWESNLGNKWRSVTLATISDYKYSYNSRVISMPQRPTILAINRLKDFNVRQEIAKDWKFVSWQSGLDYKWQDVYFRSLRVNDSTGVNDFEQADQAHAFSPYMSLDYFKFQKWFLQVGVRGTYFSLDERLRWAPRALVNFDATNWLTFKGSTGIYYQYLSQVKNLEFSGGGFDNELWTLANGTQGNVIKGTQTMIGGVLHSNGWIVEVELYRKSAEDITVYEERNLQDLERFFTMDQISSGVDFMVKKSFDDKASVWLGYSYNDSEITLDTTTDNSTYKSKYVQPHVAYIGGAYKTGNWKVSAAWKKSSGLNAQSLDVIYAENIFLRNGANRPPREGGMPPTGGGPPPRPNNPFAGRGERYGSIETLDISASYTLPRTADRPWSASLGLSLINVLDEKNLVDEVYRTAFAQRYSVGFAPNLMLVVEF